MLDWALKYIALGWHIFPIKPGTKRPYEGTHGVKDATNDEAIVRVWWTENPDAGIGLACGKASGVYAVDIDLDEAKGINGYESLAEFPKIPDTICQETPRGGIHILFSAEIPPANKNSFRLGIDIRGEGYYILLAPSIHPNGKQYEWEQGRSPWDVKPAEYPDFLRPEPMKGKTATVTIMDELAEVPPSTGESRSTEPQPAAMGHETLYGGKGGVSEPGPAGVLTAPSEIVVVSELPEDGTATTIPLASVVRLERELTSPTASSGPSAVERARLYLAQCEAAIQGHAGHDKLLWAAFCMTHRFELTDSQAYDLLAGDYNPRCDPPWELSNPADFKDFTRKISESRKLKTSKPRGDLLRADSILPVDSQYIPTEDEIQAMIAQSQPESRIIVPKPKAIITPNERKFFTTNTNGLLRELCEWIDGTSLILQPFLTLGCAITFLGALFGRKVKGQLGERTNLYIMSIADSSDGKNHAPSRCRRLAYDAGAVNLLGGNNLSSASSLEESLSKHSTQLYMLDEIGFLLRSAKSDRDYNHASIIPALMQLYSSAGDVYKGKEYADKEKQRVLVEPCCCIYGTASPTRFNEGLSSGQLADGWLGRCLVFNSEKNRPGKSRRDSTTPPPKALVDAVTWWYNFIPGMDQSQDIGKYVQYLGTEVVPDVKPPEPILVPTTPAAEKIFSDLDGESNEQRKAKGKMSGMWSKTEENARKIALILAVSENCRGPKVSGAIADYSCRLIRYLLRHFIREIAPKIYDSATEAQKSKILEIIQDTGVDGAEKSLITYYARWSNLRQRESILFDLMEGGEVKSVAFGSGGQASVKYFTTANYLKYVKKLQKAEAK